MRRDNRTKYANNTGYDDTHPLWEPKDQNPTISPAQWDPAGWADALPIACEQCNCYNPGAVDCMEKPLANDEFLGHDDADVANPGVNSLYTGAGVATVSLLFGTLEGSNRTRLTVLSRRFGATLPVTTEVIMFFDTKIERFESGLFRHLEKLYYVGWDDAMYRVQPVGIFEGATRLAIHGLTTSIVFEQLSDEWWWTGHNRTKDRGMPNFDFISTSRSPQMTTISPAQCCKEFPRMAVAAFYACPVGTLHKDTYENNRHLIDVLNADMRMDALPPGLFRDVIAPMRIDLSLNSIIQIGNDHALPDETASTYLKSLIMFGNPSTCFQAIDTVAGIKDSSLTCNCGNGYFSSGSVKCVAPDCPARVDVPSTEHNLNAVEQGLTVCPDVANGAKCEARCVTPAVGKAVYVCSAGGQWQPVGVVLDCKTKMRAGERDTVAGLIGSQISFRVPKSTKAILWDANEAWRNADPHYGNDHRGSATLDIPRKCIRPPTELDGTLKLDSTTSTASVTFNFFDESDVEYTEGLRQSCEYDFDQVAMADSASYYNVGKPITFGFVRVILESGHHYEQMVSFFRKTLKVASVYPLTEEKRVTEGMAINFFSSQKSRSSINGNIGAGIFKQLELNAGFQGKVVFVNKTRLPAGLELNERTGDITGKLATRGEAEIHIEAEARDAVSKELMDTPELMAKYTMVMSPAITELGTSGSLATVNQLYTGPVPSVIGGARPLAFSARVDPENGFSLPDGLKVDAATGQIRGVPTTATPNGTEVTIGVVATDQNGHSVNLDTVGLTILPQVTATWPNDTLPDAAVGVPFLMSNPNLSAPTFEDPIYRNRSALPPGLELNLGSGKLYGVPSQAGEYNLAIRTIDGESGVFAPVTIDGMFPMLRVYECDSEFHCSGNGNCDFKDSPFDGDFSCACKSGFAGKACGIKIDNTSMVIGSTMGSIMVVLIAMVIGYKYRAYKISMRAHDFQQEITKMLANGDITDSEARVPREIKRSCVTTTTCIGEGAFGEVYKAILDESSIGGVPGYPVAVKTSKSASGEGATELIQEAAVMAQVTGHQNLVSLVGVVTSGTPLMLLCSLCDKGSLLTVLKQSLKTEKKPLATPVKVKLMLDVARGMQHLVLHRFVHRDLAARNILVDATMTGKVADFGLARATAGNDKEENNDYYRSSQGIFPVRWTAPEAMESLRFDFATDVWSYGVVMLECFENGQRPYELFDNAQVIQHIMIGWRAEQPTMCPDAIYAIMLQCWAERPKNRPNFEEIVTALEEISVAFGGDDSATSSRAGVNYEYSLGADGNETELEYKVAGDMDNTYGLGGDGHALPPVSETALQASYSLRGDVGVSSGRGGDESAQGAYSIQGDSSASTDPVAPAIAVEGAYTEMGITTATDGVVKAPTFVRSGSGFSIGSAVGTADAPVDKDYEHPTPLPADLAEIVLVGGAKSGSSIASADATKTTPHLPLGSEPPAILAGKGPSMSAEYEVSAGHAATASSTYSVPASQQGFEGGDGGLEVIIVQPIEPAGEPKPNTSKKKKKRKKKVPGSGGRMKSILVPDDADVFQI